jgi:hypothetical protein
MSGVQVDRARAWDELGPRCFSRSTFRPTGPEMIEVSKFY